MGNLGQREKYGLALVAVLIIAFIIYFAGIRQLQSQRIELENQRNELEARVAQLDALIQNNEAAEEAIKAIEEDIKVIEKTFIPTLNTHCIEQFVMKTFEDEGCVYLNKINSELITGDSIVLPDGNIANETLQIVRVTVQYATSDGFNISQYNATPNYMRADHEEILGLIEAQFDSTNSADQPFPYDETLPMVEYNAFIRGLKTIEETGVQVTGQPSTCVKLNKVEMESEGGYMLLTAEIDFYSANFVNRLSDANLDAPYITWNGVNVNSLSRTGAMGRRLLFLDQSTEWFATVMVNEDIQALDRPFATYWSNELFDDYIDLYGSVGPLLIPELYADEQVVLDDIVPEE